MSSEQRNRSMAVSPESPPDKSYLDTVRGLIQVVQQGVSSSTKTEDKEPILWLKFEELDSNNYCNATDRSTPLVLFIGYISGLQIWMIDTVHSGLASEVLSLVRQDPVKCAALMKRPKQDIDRFADKRPLVAICDAVRPVAIKVFGRLATCLQKGNVLIIDKKVLSIVGQKLPEPNTLANRKKYKSPPFGTIKFFSLRCGEEVSNHSFSDEVLSIVSSHRVFVVALRKEIHVFDSGSLQRKFKVSKCHPPPAAGMQPIALGSRWLAYADRKLTFHYQSHGGVTSDTTVSYAASVISAASQGFSYITEQVGKLTGGHSPPKEAATEKTQSGQAQPEPNIPGILSVIDIQRVSDKINVEKENDGEAIVSHFEAHKGQPIQAVAFDPSGQLIITASKLGHDFHIFRLLPHPTCPALGSVHHLYILHRGDTTATVQNIVFTFDSRWVAVSSLRGTTHVFPIAPYGGPVNKRTHTGVRVVNRLSRYHTSAGLGEKTPSSQEVSSAICISPQTSASAVPSSLLLNQQPLPKPVTVTALAKINCRPSGFNASPDSSASSALSTLASSTAGLIYATDSVRVAAKFANSSKRHRRSSVETASPPRKPVQSAVDSLFCVGPDGVLMEYNLEVQVQRGFPDAPSSPVELESHLVQQWRLQRSTSSPEVGMPLLPNSPLICACEIPDHREQPTPIVQTGQPADDSQNTKWLAQIEIYTHEPPARRLWMGPQFQFKTYKTSEDDGGLSAEDEVADLFGTGSAMIETGIEDRTSCPSSLDLLSLNMQPSSTPIPTPHRSSHLQPRDSDIVLDAGPCSLDKTQLEICGSSPSDRDRYTNYELNEKLERNLADAMEDLNISPVFGNIDISSGFPAGASVTVTPAPGPSFHSSSAPHHAMPSPPQTNKRVDMN